MRCTVRRRHPSLGLAEPYVGPWSRATLIVELRVTPPSGRLATHPSCTTTVPRWVASRVAPGAGGYRVAMANLLEKLKEMTVVVADTGDFLQIAQYQPRDATTNPSLILKAAAQPLYRPLIEQAIAWACEQGGTAVAGGCLLHQLDEQQLDILAPRGQRRHGGRKRCAVGRNRCFGIGHEPRKRQRTIAAGLAARGLKVLLVDTDSQGNVAVSLGV